MKVLVIGGGGREHALAWKLAQSERVQSGVLINNTLLEALARDNPAAATQLEAFPGMKNWQRREFGAELLAALRTSA